MLRPKDAAAAPPSPRRARRPSRYDDRRRRGRRAYPPRPLYECITPDGERYTSDSDRGQSALGAAVDAGLPVVPRCVRGIVASTGLASTHGSVHIAMRGHHPAARSPVPVSATGLRRRHLGARRLPRVAAAGSVRAPARSPRRDPPPLLQRDAERARRAAGRGTRGQRPPGQRLRRSLMRHVVLAVLVLGCVLLAAPAVHAQGNVVIYRCTDASGALTVQNDVPCPKGEAGQTRDRRAADRCPPYVPTHRSRTTVVAGSPNRSRHPRREALPTSPPIADADRLPPPTLFQCSTYDNDSYLSEVAEPAPRCVPPADHRPRRQHRTAAPAVACEMVTRPVQRDRRRRGVRCLAAAAARGRVRRGNSRAPMHSDASAGPSTSACARSLRTAPAR